ncbi:hypothetical protein BOTBODRAFT_59915 [Botryobasidium botryosum FD-172 SS1]|uniref:BHLH domain-containing protein n=1 Tax=Botryobasidium botryosum (strain FD-172 SS1) TaxID=930990 RepID=A0A067M7G3_BOTB1|nr:hypothetical protein BOTBODRAFT_59915 [Botryobasidium botryosum FD-172 SS1]
MSSSTHLDSGRKKRARAVTITAPSSPASDALPGTSTSRSHSHHHNHRDPELEDELELTADEADDTSALSPSNAKSTGGRKGTKRSAVSRSTREALRKTNHSRIEKRRREKINDALDSLRELVPAQPIAQSATEKESLTQSSPASPSGASPPKKSEKEFKLEVLERTVVYVRYLVDKVKALEEQSGSSSGCSNCDAGEARRSVVKDEVDMDAGDSEERPSKRLKTRTPSPAVTLAASPVPAIRLPSINSLLMSLGDEREAQLPSPTFSAYSDTRRNSISHSLAPSLALSSPTHSSPPSTSFSPPNPTNINISVTVPQTQTQTAPSSHLWNDSIGTRISAEHARDSHTPGSILGLRLALIAPHSHSHSHPRPKIY